MDKLHENERAALKELKARLPRDFGLVELKLFGSKARGDSSPESDVDLVVVVREHNWQTDFRIYGVCFRIGLAHDVLLTPVIYSRAEYESDLTRATPFYRAVAAQGVSL